MKPQSSIVVIAGLFALVGNGQPAAAAPCTCADIPAFKARIKEVTSYLDAFRKVLADCYTDKAPKDFTEARQRFDRYAFGGPRPNNIATAGTATLAGAQVTPEFAHQYCDTIVSAVNDVHEADHTTFMWIHALPILVGVSFGHPYMTLVRNLVLTEVEAHEVEKEFLENELRELEARCNLPWKCRCNQQLYPSASECAAACPHASLRCVAPTCLQLDRATGKWTGKGI